ncbi:MAG: hypothetical protein ACREDO_09590 [Methyloceanibacter sp.]
MALIDKLPYRDGIDIFESRIDEGEPLNWAKRIIGRWLPQASEEELEPALRRVALYYWLGRTIKPLGRQARKRPVNWDDRGIIWLLGFVWEFYGRECGTGNDAPSHFQAFVHEAILMIDPQRPEHSLPGRQAFRTTKDRRARTADL